MNPTYKIYFLIFLALVVAGCSTAKPEGISTTQTPLITTPSTQMTTQTPALEKISILSPRNGDQVSYRTSIEGSSEKVYGTDWKIYVLIKPENDVYYVQPGVSVSSGGRWELIPYFGRDPAQSTEDIGKSFKISAIVTKDSLKEGKWDKTFPNYVARVDVNVVRK